MSVRVVPASEAADLRRQHGRDFATRFYNAMGYGLPAEDYERWWPS